MENIAVDVGRSAVKVICKGNEFSFPSIYATDYAPIAKGIQGLLSRDSKQAAKIDGKLCLFGQTARLLGSFVYEPTDGESFREVSTQATLYSAARALFLSKKNFAKVSLGINLTYENFHEKDLYRKVLLGQHSVFLQEFNQDVTFTVENVYVLYQGYTSLLDYVMDTSFNVPPAFAKAVFLVVDIGRRTVDVSYVDTLSVLSGKSYEFGTFRVFDQVSSVLKEKYAVNKENYEIEAYMQEGKSIPSLKGPSVDVKPLVKEAAESIAPSLVSLLESFFDRKTPDYLLLTGGGALVFNQSLAKVYKTLSVVKDPFYSNASGLFKFLSRVEKENV